VYVIRDQLWYGLEGSNIPTDYEQRLIALRSAHPSTTSHCGPERG